MRRTWWLVGAAALIAVALLAMPVTAMVGRAQMGPMGGQPLDQLTGDEFDKAFLAQMTMHHAMAVMMARPVVTNATHPELKTLAQTVIDDQTREIGQMRVWAKEWYGLDLPDHLGMMGQAGGPGGQMPGHTAHAGMPMHGQGHGMPMHGQGQGMPMHGQGMPGAASGGMPGMHDMSMMAALDKLPPQRLEAVFMSQMIPHHQDALDMARLVAERTARQELKDLATAILASQSAEIDQMNGWLASWYGL